MAHNRYGSATVSRSSAYPSRSNCESGSSGVPGTIRSTSVLQNVTWAASQLEESVAQPPPLGRGPRRSRGAGRRSPRSTRTAARSDRRRDSRTPRRGRRGPPPACRGTSAAGSRSASVVGVVDDPHLGRVRDDEPEVRAPRDVEDDRPVVERRDRPRDRRHDARLVHGLPVAQAADAQRVPPLLLLEQRRPTAPRRPHQDDAAVEEAGLVRIVDDRVGQAANEGAGAELEHALRERVRRTGPRSEAREGGSGRH